MNTSKAFNEYSNDIGDIYQKIEKCNPNKKRKMLIVFDDMITDMLSNKNLNPIVTELFIRGRKLNIFLVFIYKSYFTVLKKIWISSTHYFIMKILNKWELKQNAFNHLSDIDLHYHILFRFLKLLLNLIIFYVSHRIF